MASFYVENIIRAKEEEIRFQETESAYVYDLDGNLLFSKDGSATQVGFTAEELALMRGAILTHNHPNGLEYPDSDPRSYGNSFSISDMRLAAYRELAEIRIVTPKLRFTMKPSEGGWSQDYWESVLAPLTKQIRNIVFYKLILSGSPDDVAQARFWHEVWSGVALREGLKYTREEI